MNERLDVFREAKTTKAESSFQKLAADARVESHRVGDFFYVRSYLLAKISQHIGVADFQRQKRIRGVLDELGAVNGGNEKFSVAGSGTTSLVYRAVEFALKDRSVDFVQLCGGLIVVNTHHHPVRMEEIPNSRPFAQKFGIGSHAKTYVTAACVRRQNPLQFQPSACRNSTLLHHKFRRTCFRSNLLRDMVDCG